MLRQAQVNDLQTDINRMHLGHLNNNKTKKVNTTIDHLYKSSEWVFKAGIFCFLFDYMKVILILGNSLYIWKGLFICLILMSNSINICIKLVFIKQQYWKTEYDDNIHQK